MPICAEDRRLVSIAVIALVTAFGMCSPRNPSLTERPTSSNKIFKYRAQRPVALLTILPARAINGCLGGGLFEDEE